MADSNQPGVAAIRRQLTGRWRQNHASGGPSAYPDEIAFEANGLYKGSKGADGRDFTIWDVGRTEILSAHELKISTATDREIVYTFHLAGDELTITDAEGTRLRYSRVA